jgi:hypothetical protein
MDRKELKKRAKETAAPMGVYQIRNLVNGKILVGSSVNLRGIINRHRFQLKNGLHLNRSLQRDFLEVGEERFAFEILDTLQPNERGNAADTEELKMLEALWLERLRPTIAKGSYHG